MREHFPRLMRILYHIPWEVCKGAERLFFLLALPLLPHFFHYPLQLGSDVLLGRVPSLCELPYLPMLSLSVHRYPRHYHPLGVLRKGEYLRRGLGGMPSLGGGSPLGSVEVGCHPRRFVLEYRLDVPQPKVVVVGVPGMSPPPSLPHLRDNPPSVLSVHNPRHARGGSLGIETITVSLPLMPRKNPSSTRHGFRRSTTMLAVVSQWLVPFRERR